eukprot:scaffold7116_cov296-Pinguiococcus_pyrenoidosus.AAC.17
MSTHCPPVQQGRTHAVAERRSMKRENGKDDVTVAFGEGLQLTSVVIARRATAFFTNESSIEMKVQNCV